jgi:hypothetical protein
MTRKKSSPSRITWPTHTIGIEWPSFSEDQLKAWVKRKDIPEDQRKRYREALRKIEREKKAGA